MKVEYFRWLLLTYCAVLIFAMIVRSDETIGVTSDWTNGCYLYRAGSAPWALACAIVGVILYFLLLRIRGVADPRRMPHLFRRWVAGLVDFTCSLLIPAAFFGFAAVLWEYRRTGAFYWLVERQKYQPGDWLFTSVSVPLIMFVLMPSYFAFPWLRGTPTPGACIFGFRIVADEGMHLNFVKAYSRAIVGSMALLAWPSWIVVFWLKRDKRAGKFWLDAIFGTHAEFLE
jgi:uncharacterized RDD family membrane protein YckC